METEIYEKLMSKFEGLDPSLLEMLSQHLVEMNTDENGNQIKEADELVEEMTISRVITLSTEKELAERLSQERVAEVNSLDSTDEQALPDWALEIIEAHNQLKIQFENMLTTVEVDKRVKAIENLITKLPEAVRLPYTKIRVDNLSGEEFLALYNEIKEEVAKYLTNDLQSQVNYSIPFSNQTSPFASANEIEEVVKQLYI